ncbi:helix-turn-helix domain-containing protein [Streptomyces hebeiensis]|uniref:helix-turn-helix domain-containing protein n=1 Tax=Streptomyces hebeiensis TaxID=229486 RepID=UPI0031D523FF
MWEDPAVRHALSTWDFGTALRLVRESAQLSQRDMAALCGLGQATLSELEAGKRRLTHIDKIITLLQDLAVPAGLAPVALPGSSSSPETTSVAGPRWESPVEIAQRLTAATLSNTTPAAISLMKRQIDGLVDRYEEEGAHQLAPEALHLRTAIQPLLEGQQPARQRRSLFQLAAQASGLLAYMAVNAGRPVIAEAYCEEAAALATEADDPSLLMWILGTRSLAAYYDHRFNDALNWADAGIRIDPHHAQAIRLYSNGRARALGKIGDRRGTDQAIDIAQELSVRHNAPDGLTSCISFEPYGMARTLANAATAYVALGDTGRVLEYAGQIDHLVATSDSAWTQALVSLDVATALLAGPRPDIEHSMDLGRQVLEGDGGPPILSVVQRATSLYEQAKPFQDLHAVQDYRDALTAWRATPRTLELTQSVTMAQDALPPGRTAGGAPNRHQRFPSRPSPRRR